MVNWGGQVFRDGVRSYMEGVIQFNDYIWGLVIYVFWFVVVLVIIEVYFRVGGCRFEGGGILLEFVWTLLPIIILIFIAYPSLVLLYINEISSELDIIVGVVGHQWYWEYTFLGNRVDSYLLGGSDYRILGVDNRLIVPIFSLVGLVGTSRDVIHSWAIPSLGVKIDCIPGRLNMVLIEVSGCGVFYGQCSELCGVIHSYIPIVIETIKLRDFM